MDSDPSSKGDDDDRATGRDPHDGQDDDPRRDAMAPPQVPCECWCLHCGRTFMSDQMWFQRVVGDRNGFEGFWMCPTPNCGGAGFTFDIFPTDPNHPANAGWCDDDEEYDESEFNDSEALTPTDPEKDWDPDEPLYRWMDEHDDDIEGEEWKYGLEPGQPHPDAQPTNNRRNWDEDEQRYNEPDQ